MVRADTNIKEKQAKFKMSGLNQKHTIPKPKPGH